MFVNAICNSILPKTQKEIVAEWDIKISPAGWAFAIWGIIYTMLTVFVVYQALPSKYVPERSNDLIFGKIGYTFTANMIVNAFWLLIFGQDNKYCFALSFADDVLLYGTGIVILRLADANKLNGLVEKVFLRDTFSIYAGWLTTATILNIAFMLKSWGLKGDFEVTLSVCILAIAEVIYCIISYHERNPLFGAVFIWVLFAIKDFENMHAPIVSACNILLPIHAIMLVIIAISSRNPKKRGLFF